MSDNVEVEYDFSKANGDGSNEDNGAGAENNEDLSSQDQGENQDGNQDGNQENNISEEDKAAAERAAAEASQNSNQNDDLGNGSPEGNDTVIEDEVLLKSLSEKLGREVNSFEDLTTQVEDPFASDEVLKEIADFRSKTGRSVEDWLKYQEDFKSMDDKDVVRRFLQHQYPELDSKEISHLMNKEYVSGEDDDEEEVMSKSIKLKRAATDGRKTLGEYKSKFNEPLPSKLSPENQELIDLGKAAKQSIEANTQAQSVYKEKLTAAAQKAEKLSLKLSDDLTIDFKTDKEGRDSLPSYIDEMSHWRNEDGSINHESVTNDGIKIKYFNEIIKLVFEQGVNSGKEETINETNNSNLREKRGDANANQDTGTGKGMQIEGGLKAFLG